MTEKTKMVEKTFYVAKDGQEFTDKFRCSMYEKRLGLNFVYVVIDSMRRLTPEVYSTEDLAKNSLKHINDIDSKFEIYKLYVDEIER